MSTPWNILVVAGRDATGGVGAGVTTRGVTAAVGAASRDDAGAAGCAEGGGEEDAGAMDGLSGAGGIGASQPTSRKTMPAAITARMLVS